MQQTSQNSQINLSKPNISNPHWVQESQPISLVYDDDTPWQKTIRYFRTHHGQHITSLNLIFTDLKQLRSLRPLIARCSPSLSSFSIKLRGFVDSFGDDDDDDDDDDEQEEQEDGDLTLSFLKNCSHLQRLKLGRGMWNLDKSCANAAWVRSIRCLTLKQVDTSHVSFEYLDSITPQLHEFTLYQHWHLSRGPLFGSHSMTFNFPNARLLRFRFASNELKLTLNVSPALKTLSVMAKWLVLSCKSTAPLALDHLSLYGQERLVISSLRVASARAVYLNGPACDEDSSCPMISYQFPPSWQHVPRGVSGFSWTKWLRSIAQNVEVLVVRHGIPIEKVGVVWRNLRSLGIVMHAKGEHNKEWEATVENYRAFMDDGEFDDDLDEDGGFGGCYGDDDEEDGDDEDEDMEDGDGSDDDDEYGGRGYGGRRGGSRKKKAPAKPPSIGAPTLRFLFFPTHKACNAPTLAALRQDYPALALYCVVDRSFYWERKGERVSNVPLKHMRQAKSGVLRDKFDDKKKPKNVREKMHSVNRKLVEGYSVEEDEAHMFKYKGRGLRFRSDEQSDERQELDDRPEFMKMFTYRDSSASDQHKYNANSYGSSWPLLCCALASKRLLHHVLSFAERQPISLVYNDERWQKTIRYFLTRHGQHITSLHLIFTDLQQLPSFRPLIARCSPSLSSFSIKLRGFVDGFEEQEYKDWTLGFLKNCSQLQRLKLGRGMWNLDKSCANAAWVRSIRCLTLKQVDTGHVSFEYLDSITPQLHEFTLYQHWHLSRGPMFGSHVMAFNFSNARLLRFRFASNELKLTLTVSPSLKSLSVMAKWLILSCKSSASLTLDHLSLYGQERLVISSLHIASARAVYLNGPASDEESSCPGLSAQLPPSWQHVPDGISNFSWTNWLGSIAQNVEVLIVTHGIPIEEVDVVWRNLRSLGIVAHAEGPHDKEWEVTVENYGSFMDDGEYDDDMDDYDDDGEASIKPPSIGAPNLRFLFFPSSKACDSATLAALRHDYPALALYCVVDRSFYWERKGEHVSNGWPLQHVRRAKSGVRTRYDKKKQPKNVREKMHSVNKKLVEGYSVKEDEAHMLKYKGRSPPGASAASGAVSGAVPGGAVAARSSAGSAATNPGLRSGRGGRGRAVAARASGGGGAGGAELEGVGGAGGGMVLAAVLVACIGAFAFGYHISVVNGPLDHILVSIGAPGNSFVAGWVVSASLLTAACGALSVGWLADSVGRRTTFLLLSLPLALGSALSATASSVPQMLVGRALTGLAFGVISCVVPVYISEIAPASVRGRLGSLNQLAICVGILAALLGGLPLAANPAWWRQMFWIGVAPAATLAAGMLWAPESPRWLAKVGRIDEAERQLKRLLGPSQAAAAAAELYSSSAPPQPASSAKAAAVDGLEQAEAGAARKRADEVPAASFFTLFSKRYRRVVLLGMALFAVQQFAGINAIIYYSSSVFRSAGIQSDVAASALVGLANVLGTAVSLNLVDQMGRKSLLMGSFVGMGCSMLLLALTLSFPPLQPIAAPLSVLGTVAYVLSFAMGAGPVPALLLPEIFPSNIRASAVAAALTTHWLCNFVIGLSFLGFVKVVGVAAAYVGFAAVCFVGVVFVRACVVETKGRSLEEIERELIGSDA
ncbi:unnamed protein product [Closterium sp. Naga37s-1]|nr:unnamed protein product [Closterium sp. Naga37s-1]